MLIHWAAFDMILLRDHICHIQKMIQITLERKALNANGRPTENEFQNFEFHLKSLLEKEVNAERSKQFTMISDI
ncbi:hypothetical protein T02_13180 [Trichinella nativa]|uniref:Uncharacterized protein n=1 Tax=Trichinella nativa TaxID=6335 RepID=A0A0V1KNY1_9BILA|nr:hypothetical protein T02_13180 [Trichinella nativa]